MSTVTETARLRLRHIEPSDAPGFLALCQDPQVLRYTGVEPMQSLDEAHGFVGSLIERYARDGFGRWAVERRDDGEFLGWCGLRPVEGEGVDLGFWLLRRYWGQGYATEAARACVPLAFDAWRLPYLIGRAVSQNLASCTVLERLGFDPWYRAGGWGFDEIRYSVLPAPDRPRAEPDRDVVCRVGDLHARLLQPADQLDFFLLEGNPNTFRYADGDRIDYERAGPAIERLRRTAHDPDAELRVFAVSDTTRPFLGTVALVPEEDGVEIGCRLLESVQGQGLGRALTGLNLALARREYPERTAFARIDLRNDRSLRMVEGLGGEREEDRDGHAWYRWPSV